jgi:hypothetical protein
MQINTGIQPPRTIHVYEVGPRRDHRGVDLISDVLPFGHLWYLEVSHAIGYAKFYSRSHDAVIRVYDEAGNVIETQERKGDFKEWSSSLLSSSSNHSLRRSSQCVLSFQQSPSRSSR